MSQLCLDEHNPDVFRSVRERVGDKWSLLVIGILGERPHRFTELHIVTHRRDFDQNIATN